MKSNHRKLEQAVGYRFKKKALLVQAITHPSYRYESEECNVDNQRLEYLGDAVLSMISAEYLYLSNPDANEGDMSKLRSRLTEDRKLAEIASAAGIGEYLLLGIGEEKSGGATRASNLADAMEAIIGAAWVDSGARAAGKIFKKLFLPEVNELSDSNTVVNNPKGALQEYVQANGLAIPTYEVIETSGPEHARMFSVELNACGKTWSATASSKREAERQVAACAVKELVKENPD